MAIDHLQNYVHPRPPTEIEIAEEDIPNTSISSYTRGYPLPSPSQYDSSSSLKKEEEEPTLYKKVIYIPDVQLNQNVVADQKKSDWKQRSKGPPSHTIVCERLSHEHEQAFQSHCSNLPTNKEKENGGERKQPGSAAWNGLGDLRYRLQNLLHLYIKQWTHGLHGRMVFVAHLIFWASFIPAMVFGTWLQKKTNGNIGTAEVLFSSSICGIIFVLLGSQPLTIMGVSAPSLMFVAAVAETAHRLSLEFLPWMGCIGIWTSFLLMILAFSNLSRIACHLTLFSWEVVRMFAAMIFLWNGVEEILGFFSDKIPMDGSILSLWLATCTFVLGTFLSRAREWHCFERQAREVIHNYGAAFTFLLFTVLPYLPRLELVRLPRVQMGAVLYHTDKLRKFGTIVKLEHLPIWAIFLAIIPGSLLAIMMFADHNATVMLVEAEGDLKSQKSTSKSWDLFILAGLACLCGLLGVPTCYGLYRQTMKHKHALTGRQNYSDGEIDLNLKGVVEMQRVSGIAASLLLVFPLLPGVLLLVEKVPKSLLAGFFLQMSFSCVKEMKFTRRIRMFSTDSVQQPFKKVTLYTTIQLSCAVLVFVVSKTPAALLFPLFILATIWSRHYVLQKFFHRGHMVSLDQKLNSCDSGDITTVKTNHFLFKALQTNHLQQNAFQGGAIGSLEGVIANENHSSGSSTSPESPSILGKTNNRRLKERSRRRNKRKRQTSLEPPWGLLIKAGEQKISLPRERERQCNQVVPVSFETELPTTIPQQRSTFSKKSASQLKESDRPRLSTKTKKQVALKHSLEIHSNVLYNACWGNEPQLLSVSVRKKAATLEGRRVSSGQYADQTESQNPTGLYTELYQSQAFDSSEENDQYYVSKVGKLRQGASTTREGRSNKKLKLMEHKSIQSHTVDATEFATKLAAVLNGNTLPSLCSQGNSQIPSRHVWHLQFDSNKLQSRSMAMIDEDIASESLKFSSKNSARAHTPRHQRKRQKHSLIAP